jgi:hypothetical protein
VENDYLDSMPMKYTSRSHMMKEFQVNEVNISNTQEEPWCDFEGNFGY